MNMHEGEKRWKEDEEVGRGGGGEELNCSGEIGGEGKGGEREVMKKAGRGNWEGNEV